MQAAHGSNLHDHFSTHDPHDRCDGSRERRPSLSGHVGIKTLRRYRMGLFVSSMGLGPAMAGVSTYLSYQLQHIAYKEVGHVPGAPRGTGCPLSAPACRVKFGAGDVNLTSYLLYLTALASVLSGVLILLLSGIADHVSYQREQYILLLVCFGVLCLPLAALRSSTQQTLDTYAVLYTMCGILSSLAYTWSNVFVPFAMQQLDAANPPRTPDPNHADTASARSESGRTDTVSRTMHEKQGLSMSVWGSVGLSAGSTMLYLIAICLTYVNSAYAGLWTASGAGALCIVLALAAWPCLPRPRSVGRDQLASYRELLALPFMAIRTFYRGITTYPDAFKLLFAYTIYSDGTSTLVSVAGQVLNLTIRPALREYTAYILVGEVSSIISSVLILLAFARLHRAYHIELRHWMLACFIVNLFCSIWCSLGLSPNTKVGLKHHWEFYFIQILSLASNGIVGSSFRVVLSELFPRGSEIQHFGIQLALSLATAWVPGVIAAPIVNATNQPRTPMAISIGCLVIAILLLLWTDEKRGREKLRLSAQGSAAAT